MEVWDLRKLLCEIAEIPEYSIVLRYGGKPLNDSTISFYNIPHNATLQANVKMYAGRNYYDELDESDKRLMFDITFSYATWNMSSAYYTRKERMR